jgi:hypothetical protein
MVMRQAETGKIKFGKDDTLIVAYDVGMEMNRRYCTTFYTAASIAAAVMPVFSQLLYLFNFFVHYP